MGVESSEEREVMTLKKLITQRKAIFDEDPNAFYVSASRNC